MTPRHCSCTEFSRAHLLRQGVAQAGNGLPAIETGMPIPAGTGLSRRHFLAGSVGLALSVYGASHLGLRAFEEGIAAAAERLAAGRILVTVFLEGGADGLSMLAPVNDPVYRKLRPKLALRPGAGPPFGADSRLMWHPSLYNLAVLHNEGKIAALPAVGYDHPDQSHFTSRHYWEVGATDPWLQTGWMGRLVDAVGTPDNPLQGLSMDGHLSPSLATAKMPVASVDGPDGYDFSTAGVWGDVHDAMLQTLAGLGTKRKGDPALRAAAEITSQSANLYAQLLPFQSKDGKPSYTSPVRYPSAKDSSFPTRLAGLAAMIASGLPLQCVSLSGPGGYDTHGAQAPDLTRNLKLTADSLLAFQRDLEARGLQDRVLTLVWSEFGRRAEENGSAGTDHGAGGTAFVIGNQVRGGMIGEFPGLGKGTGIDDNGNLRATTDFRSLYRSLLEQWFQVDPSGVLPDAGTFAAVPLVK
ncbi:MAG: hypothetical protein QOE29_1834 [Gaiellaceae bacterium]|nr:hypothetical protein [Gaiellaceae bacterium]